MPPWRGPAAAHERTAVPAAPVSGASACVPAALGGAQFFPVSLSPEADDDLMEGVEEESAQAAAASEREAPAAAAERPAAGRVALPRLAEIVRSERNQPNPPVVREGGRPVLGMEQQSAALLRWADLPCVTADRESAQVHPSPVPTAG